MCKWFEVKMCLSVRGPMKTDADVSGLRVVWWMLVACMLSGGY